LRCSEPVKRATGASAGEEIMGGRQRKHRSVPIPEGLEGIRLDPPLEEFAVLWWPLEPPPALAKLPPGEAAVARLAASGFSNKEIALARKRSERTIANQLASIYRKLGVGSRANLTAYLARVALRRTRE
jgi:DNA-binding NarL/FixJ family response regulator